MDAQAAVIQMVETHAISFDLDPYTILGLIKVESDFNPMAYKFEPKYKDFYKIPVFAKLQNIDEISETVMQAISWGMLQLMGANARAMGFNGPLWRLSDAETGIIWGIRFFKSLGKRYEYLSDQISAYNWGHLAKDTNGKYKNQPYVDAVLQAVEEAKQSLAGGAVSH